jgi:hypothetical protein
MDLNVAVPPSDLPMKDIICAVENSIHLQGTVRILSLSKKPTNSISRAKK